MRILRYLMGEGERECEVRGQKGERGSWRGSGRGKQRQRERETETETETEREKKREGAGEGEPTPPRRSAAVAAQDPTRGSIYT